MGGSGPVQQGGRGPAAGVLAVGAISAAGRLGDATADMVARVSMLGYLGSFVGPGVIGALAGALGLPAALALPATLVAATVLGARALRPPSRAPARTG